MSAKPQNHGTKVTDPHSIIQESAGPIASDSLAAESQAFQSANRNAQPLGVSGSNSTFNTTDTSSATTLPPARVASDRLSSTDTQSTYPDNLEGQDKNAAVEGTYDSPNNSKVTEQAPSYINNVLHAADAQKPKGKNLNEVEDEGEFERGENVSFTADIGSKNDPSRLAEDTFEARAATGVRAAGEVTRDVKGGKGAFGVLDAEEPAT